MFKTPCKNWVLLRCFFLSSRGGHTLIFNEVVGKQLKPLRLLKRDSVQGYSQLPRKIGTLGAERDFKENSPNSFNASEEIKGQID